MARNLARAGFPLVLSTRTIAKAHALAAELTATHPRVRAADRPEDVARESDVVVSCLPDSPEVAEVHLGPSGTVRGAARGTIVIDCSTTAADAARRIAEDLAKSGLRFLDAPVSGGQKGAAEGTLTFFVGGDAGALEQARPVFEAMGKRVLPARASSARRRIRSSSRGT
jgi:3-hydroxyisobutyrate dehydrogenase